MMASGSPPGDTIRDIIEERNWTAAAVAVELHLTSDEFEALLDGSKRLTPLIAIRLETVMGSSARFWLNREKNYRESKRV